VCLVPQNGLETGASPQCPQCPQCPLYQSLTAYPKNMFWDSTRPALRQSWVILPCSPF
jgi:hypothetical protein